MQVAKWKLQAAVAKQRNPKSLATFRPVSPKAMSGPIRPVNRLDDNGKTMFFALDTVQQLRLYAAANRLLAKSGYFHSSAVDFEDSLPEATMIGQFGLRPIWHGKA